MNENDCSYTGMQGQSIDAMARQGRVQGGILKQYNTLGPACRQVGETGSLDKQQMALQVQRGHDTAYETIGADFPSRRPASHASGSGFFAAESGVHG